MQGAFAYADEGDEVQSTEEQLQGTTETVTEETLPVSEEEGVGETEDGSVSPASVLAVPAEESVSEEAGTTVSEGGISALAVVGEATVPSEQYPTIESAAADASVSTIVLTEANYNLTGSLNISRDLTFKSDSGAVITATGLTRHIYAWAPVRLAFTNVTLDGGGAGGGILLGAAGMSVIDGARIINCVSSDKGGAIMTAFDTGVSLTLTGSVVSGNSAVSNGGGVYCYGNIIVESCVISDNVSAEQGGGVYTFLGATISGSTFSGNRAVSFGGGVDAFSGTVTVGSGSHFSGNSISATGGKRGGGAVCGEVSDVLVSGTDISFDGNAAGVGSAIFANGQLDITDGTSAALANATISFTNNTGAYATYSGGVTNVNGNVLYSANYAAAQAGGELNLSGNVVVTGHNKHWGILAGSKLNIDGGKYTGNVGARQFATAWLDAKNCEISNNTDVESGGGDYATFMFTDGEGVHVKLTNVVMTGNANHSGDFGSGGALFYIRTGGAVEVDGLTYSGNTGTQNGLFRNWGPATVTNSTFTNNTGSNGTAFTAFGDGLNYKVDIIGCTFTGNVTTGGYSYGAIRVGGDALISGCVFTDNHVSNGGSACGGAVAFFGSRLHVTDCAFANNTSDGYAGHMLADAPEILIEDSTFDGGSAPYGGALYLQNATNAVVRSSSLTNNASDYYAGGIFVNNVKNFTASGLTAGSNRSMYAGVFYLRGTADGSNTAVIEDSVFTGNHADEFGGVFYARINGTLDVTGSTFTGNDATNGTDGWTGVGAFYANTVGTISGCTLTGNYAEDHGGALCVSADSELTIKDSLLSGNYVTAEEGEGGAVFTDDLSRLHTDGVTFESNSAPRVYARGLTTADETLHTENILDTVYTAVFPHAYNNADINYTPDEFALRYMRNFSAADAVFAFGGSGNPDDPFPLLLEAAEVEALGWTRDGYAFAGWTLDAEGLEPFDAPASFKDASITLYAQWTPMEVEVVPTVDPPVVPPVEPPVVPPEVPTVDTPVTPLTIAEVIAAAPAPVAAAIADATAEVLEVETPLADIDEEASPRAASENTWPLLNLILMILGAFVAVLAVAIRRKSEEEEDEQQPPVGDTRIPYSFSAPAGALAAEEKKHGKAKWMFAAVSVVAAVAGICFWILTEDFAGKMVITDRYTLMQGCIAAATLLTAILARALRPDGKERAEQAHI
ncbi:MAG: InlB B-repeat-containing protein [Clostridiales Family XIII bacterium]|jgi:uncharacterized repeat protein (TIGR02543 family)|nr:InlB B-repeat-containing protein [Clostridiales Family XIII bacterium]